MDKNDELYFLQQLEEYKKEILKSVQEDMENIMKEAIEVSIYQAYSPTSYSRTYDFKNSVKSEFKDDKLLIYVD